MSNGSGLIGVVVPLYLAECLSASHRGKGTGIFQWLLTLGLVDGGVHVDNVAAAGVTAGVVDVRPCDDAAVAGMLVVVE